jgi:hypothetical protein
MLGQQFNCCPNMEVSGILDFNPVIINHPWGHSQPVQSLSKSSVFLEH